MTRSSPGTIIRRLLMLIIGPLYLLVVAAAMSEVGQIRWFYSLIWVIAGSVVLMATFTMFGLRAFEYRESQFQFGLQTAFLITVPAAIYLATIRWVLKSSMSGSWGRTSVASGVLASFSYVVLTTIVLMGFAEALMWCAVCLLTWLNKIKVKNRKSRHTKRS